MGSKRTTSSTTRSKRPSLKTVPEQGVADADPVIMEIAQQEQSIFQEAMKTAQIQFLLNRCVELGVELKQARERIFELETKDSESTETE